MKFKGSFTYDVQYLDEMGSRVVSHYNRNCQNENILWQKGTGGLKISYLMDVIRGCSFFTIHKKIKILNPPPPFLQIFKQIFFFVWLVLVISVISNVISERPLNWGINKKELFYRQRKWLSGKSISKLKWTKIHF